MKYRLELSNGKTAVVEFAGGMKEAHETYCDKPYRVDDTESLVRQIFYIPDDVSICRQNVTACFIGDFGTTMLPCFLFHLGLAPYYAGQIGHQIRCVRSDGRELTRSCLYRPRILLIEGDVHIPDHVLWEIEPAGPSFAERKTSRLAALDDANLDLIAQWCSDHQMPYEFL